MLFDFCYNVLLFFIFSVVGYIIEISHISIKQKKFVWSRGYLLGPYLPIFGIGGWLMVYFLSKYQNDIVAIFVFSMIICCLLEYITSFLMEKLFKLRWWDYSNRRFNINGRICLENGILFGFVGVWVLFCLNPVVANFIYDLDNSLIYFFGIFVFIIMLLDLIVSTVSILKLKIDTSLYTNQDATSRVKKEIIESLSKYMFYYKRLFVAFPDIMKSKTMRIIRNNVESVKEKKK